ncbi:HSP20-like chaperone [Corchorus capsularis]|uniref:HSP20-like chaperone n=1 Tax=Corchorus capsularis TaxID=210143 RepID=A0A1R3HZR1_COCAP|nr:HSP20-like chaperone [Corchorus capsularis]
MRPRNTGISGGSRPQQPQSQNFKPKTEWKHEEAASFLFLYLPGVEQLTITPDYSNGRVKVEGQRRLPNNRLLPVNETFTIPEDCDLAKMDKQFGRRGILTLKMPRNIAEPPKETTTSLLMEATKTSKPQEDATTAVDNSVSAEVVPTDEKSAMKEEININDEKGKQTKPENLENVEEEKSSNYEQSKESVMATATDDANKVEEKQKQKGNAKVKDLNEDSKLIINMGAAVLIVVGVGVSLFYFIP